MYYPLLFSENCLPRFMWEDDGYLLFRKEGDFTSFPEAEQYYQADCINCVLSIIVFEKEDGFPPSSMRKMNTSFHDALKHDQRKYINHVPGNMMVKRRDGPLLFRKEQDVHPFSKGIAVLSSRLNPMCYPLWFSERKMVFHPPK